MRARGTSRPARLFMVESPFQLLSATEAAAAIRPEERAVLVVFHRVADGGRNREQIGRLTGLHGWDRVESFDLAGGSRSRRRLQRLGLIGLIGRLRRALGGPLGAAFIGEYRMAEMHLVANVLQARESWILDDGTAILRLTGQPELGWQSGDALAALDPVRRAALRLAFADRFEPPAGQRRHIFTAFHQFFDDPRVVPNRFSRMAQARAQDGREPLHAIVGQKLSEVGICGIAAELDILSRVKADIRSRGDRPVYLPHRHDSPEKLARIRNDLNLPIRACDVPIEIDFLTGPHKPGSVAGFYSTALFTLPMLFPGLPVTAYRLPEAGIAPAHRGSVARFYEALSGTGARLA